MKCALSYIGESTRSMSQRPPGPLPASTISKDTPRAFNAAAAARPPGPAPITSTSAARSVIGEAACRIDGKVGPEGSRVVRDAAAAVVRGGTVSRSSTSGPERQEAVGAAGLLRYQCILGEPKGAKMRLRTAPWICA